MKQKHDKWVQDQLAPSQRPKIKVYKAASEKNGIPVTLVPDGSLLLDMVAGCMAGHYKAAPARTQQEAELLGGFLQQVQDWNDILDEIEVGGRVRAEFALTEAINELLKESFVVYAGRVERTLDCNGDRSPWPCSVVSVVRIEDARSENYGGVESDEADARPRTA